MRALRLVLGPLAGLALGLAAPAPAGATTPPPPSPPGSPSATSVPATVSAPGAASPAAPASSAPAATSTTVPALARAGSAIGALDRRRETARWSVRRIVTATLLGIAALSIVGHVYGRIQSVRPRVGRMIAQREG